MSKDLSSFPVPPHGGVLVDRVLRAEDAEALRRLASGRPALVLEERGLLEEPPVTAQPLEARAS